MSKEKQIEEMARVVDEIFKSELGVNFNDDILAKIAERLYDADCRKQSEVEKLNNELIIWKQDRFNFYQKLELHKMAREKVAREIFEEIEKYNRSPLPECKPVYILKDGEFAELKKKYAEGEE